MRIIPFEQIEHEKGRFGGKAEGLGRLFNSGLKVPRGAVIPGELDEHTWVEAQKWWADLGHPPLAVRSSARSEDSGETSFAGQNRTYLHVKDTKALKRAIESCFASIHGDSSQAYRSFFKSGSSDYGDMNVVLQEMVEPQFSGVYFSKDPITGSSNWVLEVVAGLGEALVSGQTHPGRVRKDQRPENLPPGFTESMAQEVAATGARVAQTMGYPVDMEWAIDDKGQVQVLQARPITTLSLLAPHKLVEKELVRLKSAHPKSVTWDGQTFAEWNGLPSYLTFSVWYEAFTPHNAFGTALTRLGYLGFESVNFKEGDSLLEKVFGRAYINLDKLASIYYGPIPYVIVPKPRPHSKFRWRKVSLAMIAHMPFAVMSMIKVAWNVSTKRTYWLDRSSQALNSFKSHLSRPLNPNVYQSMSDQELTTRLSSETRAFSKEHLHWPFVLVVLTESTLQRLRMLLVRVLGQSQGESKLREWMGAGLKTVTSQMYQEYQKSCVETQEQPFFMAKYGHRGPGEMDLKNPRWIELKESAFSKGSAHILPLGPSQTSDSDSGSVEREIQNLKTLTKDSILEEWRLLKQLLEAREQWKMELLKPYAEIRFMVTELGKKRGIGDDIHWLRLTEILDDTRWPNSQLSEALRGEINERKAKHKIFKTFSFPDVLNLEQVESVINPNAHRDLSSLDGEAISPGIAFGEVRIVEDPATEDVSTWAPNTVIVAEATDPGWTPLFIRAKGIIIERGGVLSHCAIVAREMGIPAVSGVRHVLSKFKSGDKVWIDGHTGRVSRDEF